MQVGWQRQGTGVENVIQDSIAENGRRSGHGGKKIGGFENGAGGGKPNNLPPPLTDPVMGPINYTVTGNGRSG
jgi:hypothetical protein